MFIRYAQVTGFSPWMECKSVEAVGPWLVVKLDDQHHIMVPDHIVRGEVQIYHGDQPPST